MQNVYCVQNEYESCKDFSGIKEAKNIQSSFIKLGVISKALGSSYVQSGNTKILCAIYGPNGMSGKHASVMHDMGSIRCDVKYMAFADGLFSEVEKGQTGREKHTSDMLHAAISGAVLLDRLPKTVLQVHVEVIQADGGEWSSMINAASLALMDARVEMMDMVVSSMVAMDESGEYVVDPDQAQLKSSAAYMLLAMLPNREKVAHVASSGAFTYEQVQKMMAVLKTACSGPVYDTMKSSIEVPK